MYKLIITDEPDGFPLVLDKSVQFMQESWSEAIEAIGAALGKNAIISGCDNVAGVISPGWITVGGELLYFVGGNRMDTFYVGTEYQNVEYEGGVLKPKLKIRKAQFGISITEQYNWTDWENTSIESRMSAAEKLLSDRSNAPDDDDHDKIATTKATTDLQNQINALKAIAYSGTVHIGNLSDSEAARGYDATQLQILAGNTWESIFKLTFPAGFTMPNNSYLVIPQLKNNGFNTAAQFQANRGTVVMIGQKLTSGFYFSVNISASNDPGNQDLYMDYFLIKI